MAAPTKRAFTKWENTDGIDYLQLITPTGNILGWIDNAGVGNGTLSALTGAASTGVTGFREDFIHSSNLATVGNTIWTADTNWFYGIVGANAPSGTANVGTFNNPGQMTCQTSGTASGDGASLSKNIYATLGILGTNPGWELNGIFSIQSATSVCVRFGFCGNVQYRDDSPADGIYVEYDTANTGNTSTKFTWVTRVGGTSSYNTVNAIVPDTNFHHFKIRSLAAGTILFSVDGGSEAAITTGVTSSALVPFFQIIQRTTTLKSAILDFISYVATPTRT